MPVPIGAHATTLAERYKSKPSLMGMQAPIFQICLDIRDVLASHDGAVKKLVWSPRAYIMAFGLVRHMVDAAVVASHLEA